MVQLFKSLVRPTLEYGNTVWAPCLIKNITFIENVQRLFIKHITGMNNLEYEQRLYGTKITKLGIQESKRRYDWKF